MGEVGETWTEGHGHKDIVHDVAFDFYGLRMATCSTDQFIRIWQRSTHGATWALSASFKVVVVVVDVVVVVVVFVVVAAADDDDVVAAADEVILVVVVVVVVVAFVTIAQN
jgi:Kef-type K+ transport system membrane component KefB